MNLVWLPSVILWSLLIGIDLSWKTDDKLLKTKTLLAEGCCVFLSLVLMFR